MEKLYNLSFHIGHIECALVSVHPYRESSGTNRSYYEHNHHYFEIHSVREGACTFQVGGSTARIGSDSLLLIPPEMYHKEVLSTENNSRMNLAFSLKKTPGDTSKDSLFFYGTFTKNRHPVIIPICESLRNMLDLIHGLSEIDSGDFLIREKLKAACNSLLLTLFETLAEGQCRQISRGCIAAPSTEYVIDNFFAVNFMAGASKALLAQQLNVSTRQLHRILTERYGKNYREKSCEIRLQVALGFLTDTDKSIAEISRQMGYSSPENFATFIKNATGKTPGKIRREGV